MARWYRRRKTGIPDESVEGLEPTVPRGESVGQVVGAAVILVAVALLLVGAVWIVRTWF